ncbi:MAG: hypothetical protein M3393_09550 [Actinomycetota bacterium]|nr:hypothetical protein [Actinomycetota bacterium]
MPPRKPDTGNDTEDGAPPGMPRWVKASGVIAGIAILVLVALTLLSSGDHGPGRHASQDHQGEQKTQPEASADEALDGAGLIGRVQR